MPSLTSAFDAAASIAGFGAAAWSSPSFALLNDGKATSTPNPTNTGTELLQLTMGSNLAALPDGATIDGFELGLGIEHTDWANGAVGVGLCTLFWGGAGHGTGVFPEIDFELGIATLQVVGGASDLWGATPTAANVKNSDFGIILGAIAGGGGLGQFRADYFEMTIHYTLPNVGLFRRPGVSVGISI